VDSEVSNRPFIFDFFLFFNEDDKMPWLFIFIISTTVFFLFLTKRRKSRPSHTLSFSDTQKLGAQYYLPLLMSKSTRVRKILLDQSLPRQPFPSDNQVIRKELDQILQKQASLTSKISDEIKRQANEDTPMKLMGASPSDMKSIVPFFNKILNPVIIKLKTEFDRVRPQFLDDRIRPVVPLPTHPSYPSGHSTQAYAVALILSRKSPEKTNSLMKIAHQIAENREYAGLHYPSDTAYGKKLAFFLVNRFFSETV
jgi:membrane-associated phospholipid phosphatase